MGIYPVERSCTAPLCVEHRNNTSTTRQRVDRRKSLTRLRFVLVSRHEVALSK